MLQAVLNLDMDFFTDPPYFGRFYGNVKPESYSTFHATSSIWLSTEDFIKKTNLTHRIRGAKMRNDNQSFLYIKKMIDEKVLEPKRFTIVNFDSHHDAYVHWDEHWYRSVDGTFHNYDNMIAPFIHGWVDEIIWVTPDYMTEHMFNSQFNNMNTTKTGDVTIIHISAKLKIRIKRIKWSDYNPESFDWKYMNLITNPEMSKVNPTMIGDLSKFVSVF